MTIVKLEKTDQIRSLNQHHLYFDHLILQYQIKLMHGVYSAAMEEFNTIKKLMILHLKDEEKILLPLYSKLISPIPPGGAVEFFLNEHNMINRYFDQFDEVFSNWATIESVGKIELVHHFDILYKFKHLLEHHHTREHTFLFRLLDRTLDKTQKNEILVKFTDITS